MKRASSSLGSLLVREGAVSPDDMASAFVVQITRQLTLDSVLLDLGLLSEEALRRFLAEDTGYPEADAALLQSADPEASTFPLEWAERLDIAPCRLGERGVEAVAAQRVDPRRLASLAELLEVPVVLHAAPSFRVHEIRARVYRIPLAPADASLVTRFGASAGGAVGEDTPTPEELAAYRLETAGNRGEVIEALRELLTTRFRFGEIYVIHRGALVPAGATRPRILLDEPSLLANVAASGLAFKGPVAAAGNEDLFRLLGRARPREALLVPILLGGKIACVLWGDNEDAALPDDAAEVETVAPAAERALSRLVAARRRPPSEG